MNKSTKEEAKTRQCGSLVLSDIDDHQHVGRCRNCGSDVFRFPLNIRFVNEDYLFICCNEHCHRCVNYERPEIVYETVLGIEIPGWVKTDY